MVIEQGKYFFFSCINYKAKRPEFSFFKKKKKLELEMVYSYGRQKFREFLFTN